MAKQQWCANCGTVSNDGTCHCTDEFMSPGHVPDWHPYPFGWRARVRNAWRGFLHGLAAPLLWLKRKSN